MDDRPEPTVPRRTLARALEIAGSEEKLANYLRLPLGDMQSWSKGEAALPNSVLLALMDIVAANALTPAALRTLERAKRS
jgi:hypothetical protein